MNGEVIKFVSADGLVRYEPSRNTYPLPIIQRLCTPRLSVLSMSSTEPWGPVFVRRAYELYDRYVDVETGKFIQEYREKI